MDSSALKPGDPVIRLLAGTILIPMRVVRVEDGTVDCTHRALTDQVALRRGVIWTFDARTGWEIDHELGWGPSYGASGSELLADDAPVPHGAERRTGNDIASVGVRVIELSAPVDGVEQQYQQDRALHVDATAEAIIGRAGRMIAISKSGYTDLHPDHLVVFNANVCTESRGKIWFGDLDITDDEPLLLELAAALGEAVYVLYERDARFATAKRPQLDRYVLKAASDGSVACPSWIVRGADSRLRLTPAQGSEP